MNKNVYKKVIIWISAIVLAVVPFYNLVINGIYNWHIQQPEVVEGGCEVLIFFMISLIIGYFGNYNKSGILILLCAFIYLSTNGVIIPVVFAYLYIECILYIGYVVCTLSIKQKVDRIVYFVLGISIWGTLAIIMSLFKHGTINELRWMTIVLFIAFLFLDEKRSYTISAMDLVKYINSIKNNKIVLFLIVLVIYIFCILFAKTNSALDYDSLWYGLRPEYVLVGDNSFYDYLGYSAFVYYYPKLMEFFYLPISGLGDYSFIISMNIFIMSLLIYSLYRLIKDIGKVKNERVVWVFLLSVCTIPALANISATAKPDVLGCFFVVISLYFFTNYIVNRSTINIAFAYVSLALCTGTKETYLLWGGVTFIFYFLWTIKDIVSGKLHILDIFRENLVVWIPSLFFILGIHFRTYLLTGYPIYPICVNLLNKLGFSARNGLKNSQISIITSSINVEVIAKRIHEYIFNPSDLSHVVMLWTSNVLVFLVVIFLCYYKKKEKSAVLIDIYAFVNFTIMLYYMCFMSQPDGNYFIYPIIVISLVIICKINNGMIQEECIPRIMNTMFPLIIVNIIILFISHPSWSYGTHVPDGKILRDNYETRTQNEISYQYNGYSEIVDYIRMNMGYQRIISSYLDYTVLGRIEGAVESYWEIENDHFSSGVIMQDYDSFKSYVMSANISGVMILNEDDTLLRYYTEKYIDEFGYSCEISDCSAVLYVF